MRTVDTDYVTKMQEIDVLRGAEIRARTDIVIGAQARAEVDLAAIRETEVAHEAEDNLVERSC